MPLVIVPSIDLRGGQVVRLKQGDYGRQVTYDVDPLATARAFVDAGARWMHIVDLDGAKEGRPVQTELIGRIIKSIGSGQSTVGREGEPTPADRRLLTADFRVQCGGGVRTTDDIRRLLDAGASRVVVGTAAMENWNWFEKLVHDPAFQDRIVLALDAKEEIVATRGWTESAGQQAVEVARRVSDWPLASILYTDVAKDGMMIGPNLEQTRRLAEAGRVPVIASGGVGSIEHIRQLLPLPVWGLIVGRSLYEGTVDLREAIAVASR